MGPKRHLSRLLPYLFALGALLLAGCAGAGEKLLQNPMDPAGPVLREQLKLLNLTLWFTGLIGVIVAVVSIYVVLRFRQKPGQEKVVPKQVEGNTKLEIAWTLIPIIILSIVAVPTVQVAFWLSNTPKDAMKVRAIGNQWWFAFEYEEQGFVEGNELIVPVNKPVLVTLESNDVIHSFWIPQLAGKVDMIPNRKNTLWFSAEKEGLYYGQCAEFCGLQHAKMRFRVRVVSQAHFDQFVADRKAPYKAPTDAVAKKGEEIFSQKCVNCHNIDGFSGKGKIGPNLSSMGSRASIGAGILPNETQYLKEWVANPWTYKEGIKMPPGFGLKPEEVDAVVVYLQSLKAGPSK